MDRRVRRTRDLLHAALMALIVEKGYDRTTVADILDRADVGRSTFYAHFRSKDDLLVESGVDYLRAVVAAEDADEDSAGEPLAPARTIFRLADANRPLLHALTGPRARDFTDRTMRAMLTEVFADRLRGQVDDRTLAFVVHGLAGLLTWWLETKAPYTADEMYESYLALASPALA